MLVVRYEELVADLEGRMRWLADRLRITVGEDRLPALVEAAGFTAMRADAATRVPDQRGVLKDAAAFFRRGRPGAGREALPPSDVAAYEERLRVLVAGEAPGREAEVLRVLGL